MIDRREISDVAARFGVPDSQIVRDHLISHVLKAVADWSDSEPVAFFGGTALCRTWLTDHRLSEDIDLLVDATFESEHFRQHITRHIRREFPNSGWTSVGAQHQVETWALASDNLDVKVQLVQWRTGWQQIPFLTEPVDLRYSDLPDSTDMLVPTPSGFAAMKLLAWFDRHTPRDLYDLAALADANYIDVGAVTLVKEIAGFTPNAATLDRRVPQQVASSWQSELGHQLPDTSTADHCLEKVRTALHRLDTAS